MRLLLVHSQKGGYYSWDFWFVDSYQSQVCKFEFEQNRYFVLHCSSVVKNSMPIVIICVPIGWIQSAKRPLFIISIDYYELETTDTINNFQL